MPAARTLDTRTVMHPKFGRCVAELIDFADYSMGIRLCLAYQVHGAPQSAEFPMPSEAEGRRLMAKLPAAEV